MRFILLLLSTVAALAQFQPGVLISAPTADSAFVLADLNLDNQLDLAVANFNPGYLAIFLGSGDGDFTLVSGGPFAIEPGVKDIIAGDFNNDGKPDLAMSFVSSVVEPSPHARVWLGLGTGFFSPAPIAPAVGLTTDGIFRMAAADFDRDGNLDLVFLGYLELVLLRGNGSGGLTSNRAVLSIAGAGPSLLDVDAGDVNGDGNPDVVIVLLDQSRPTALMVGRGDGHGAFSFTTFRAAAGAFGNAYVELADADGDGALDAYSAGLSQNSLRWTNSGSGGFSSQATTFAEVSLDSLATADFNFDGKGDAAISNFLGQSLHIVLGSEQAPQPASGSPFAFGSRPGHVVAGDINGDHKPDLLITDANGLRVLRNVFPGFPTVYSQRLDFPPVGSRFLGTAPAVVNGTSSSGLPVIFTSSTTQVCDIISKNLIKLIRSGTCVILVRQPGNQTYVAAESLSRSFTVSLAPQAITFAPLSDRAVTSAPFSIAASASSNLPVSFVAGPPGICSFAGSLVTVLAVGQCSITASQVGNSTFAAATPVTQMFNVTGGPRLTSVTNAASYAGDALSPGCYGVLFGTGLAPEPSVSLRDATGALRALELIFAGATQINFIVPASAAQGPAAIVVFTAAGAAEFPVTIAATAPGLFSANGSGQGLAAAQALIVNNDKSVTTLTVADGPIPVRSGTEIYLVLYGTGIRGHGPEVLANIAGRPVEVLYAGPQSGYPGLDQVNLKVPLSLGGLGNVEIRLTVDGIAANVVAAHFQ